MNAAANDDTTLAYRAQCGRHQRTDWREDDCRIELARWRDVGITRPDRAHVEREGLCRFVPGAGKGVNLALLVTRYLCNDMGGGPETVNTEPHRIITGH